VRPINKSGSVDRIWEFLHRRARAARTGRNPRTGETVQIAAAKTVKFTAGKAFKDAVNGA